MTNRYQAVEVRFYDLDNQETRRELLLVDNDGKLVKYNPPANGASTTNDHQSELN